MLFFLFALFDRIFAPAPPRGRVGWLSAGDYAHRGLHRPGTATENTLAAFSRAIAAGLGIELDVQRSRDDQAVVFHDEDLERLTCAHGAVTEMRAAALTRIVTNGGEPIPSLAQALEFIAGRVPLLIEIKVREGSRVTPLCLAVRRLLEGYNGPVAVMSFDPRVARWFYRYARHVVRGLIQSEHGRRTLTGGWRRHISLWHARPDFLAYDIADLPSRFAAGQRRRGLPVLTWTIDSPERAARADEHADASIAEGAGLVGLASTDGGDSGAAGAAYAAYVAQAAQ